MADPYFGLGENYWKGPIWIQMNWLALKALSDKYTKESGPYQQLAIEIYRELRANVVDNVFKVGSFAVFVTLARLTSISCCFIIRSGSARGIYGSNMMPRTGREGEGELGTRRSFTAVPSAG